MLRKLLPGAFSAALLVTMSQSIVLGVGTPAGTAIPATCTMTYLAGSASLSANDSVFATVAPTAGVTVRAEAPPESVSPGQSYYTPVTITNTGNATDSASLSSSSLRGWMVSFIRDDNNDGVHQSSETTVVTGAGALSADASSRCFVCVAVPSGAATGDTVTITGTSVSGPSVSANAMLVFPVPESPNPPPELDPIPGDFNADGVVNANDIALFNQRWLRWHQSSRPAYNAAVDAMYDLAPRSSGVWPDWTPIGDRAINIQDATAFIECCTKSRSAALAYNAGAQIYRTSSLIIVSVTSAPYGIYQATVMLAPGTAFRPTLDGNGNLSRVLRGSRTGSLLYSEYDAATRTIRITGTVTGYAPYTVASIYVGY
jgi:hypothetical protein